MQKDTLATALSGQPKCSTSSGNTARQIFQLYGKSELQIDLERTCSSIASLIPRSWFSELHVFDVVPSPHNLCRLHLQVRVPFGAFSSAAVQGFIAGSVLPLRFLRLIEILDVPQIGKQTLLGCLLPHMGIPLSPGKRTLIWSTEHSLAPDEKKKSPLMYSPSGKPFDS